MRSWFACGMRRLKEEREGLREALRELQEEIDEAVIAEAKRIKPKYAKKLLELSKAKKIVPPERGQAIVAPFLARAELLREKASKNTAVIEACLVVLAPHCKMRASTTPITWTTTEARTFASRVGDPAHYAAVLAEAWKDHAEWNGLKANVIPLANPRDPIGKIGVRRFEIVVFVDARIDLEILKRRSGPPLEEWARRCRARGTDPHVFYPKLELS